MLIADPSAGPVGAAHSDKPLDVRAAIVTQLTACGVAEIRRDDRCTTESPELYSYRRERPTGRVAGYLWLAG